MSIPATYSKTWLVYVTDKKGNTRLATRLPDETCLQATVRYYQSMPSTKLIYARRAKIYGGKRVTQ
jgi:hypothetical protein